MRAVIPPRTHGPTAPPRPADRGDRFTLADSLLALPVLLLVAFGHELDRAFNLSLVLVPLLLVPVVLLLVTLTVRIARNLLRRRWRRALSALAAPGLAAAPLVLCGALGVTPDRVRFRFERAGYERAVAETAQPSDGPRLIAFDRGGTGGATGPNIDDTLVYDESDEIGLPPQRRSAAWRARADGQPVLRSIAAGHGDPVVRRLCGHFYEVAQIR